MKNTNTTKTLKGLLAACVVTLAVTSLAACNNTNDASDAKELVIWAWNKNVDTLNAGIKSYQENIDSNFKAHVESFARKDIDMKFKTASQNGSKNNMGDIILCDASNILTYYDLWSDIFTDINDSVSAEERSKLVSSTLDTVSLDGKLIGLPIGIGPTVVFANKTLWDEATIKDVQTNGWTWDQYIKIGKDIKESKGNDITMTSYNMRGDDRIYRTLTSQKGEWFMDKKYNVQVGNETSINAMTKVKEMVDEGVVGHIDTGDYKSLMKANKIAAQIQGFFLGGQLKDIAPEMAGDWAVLPLPRWNDGCNDYASITGGSYLYANSKLDGADKENAISFIKYMTLNENSVLNTLKIGGIFPALKTAYDKDEFKNTTDAYFGNEHVYTLVGDMASKAKPIAATKFNAFNYDVFMKAQENILFNQGNINKELAKAKEAMIDNAK